MVMADPSDLGHGKNQMPCRCRNVLQCPYCCQASEGGETIPEVANNEEAVGEGQHPGPGTFWVFLAFFGACYAFSSSSFFSHF